MKLLILGAYGMLGHKLGQRLQTNFDVFATCRSRRNFNVPGLLPDDRIIEGVTAEDLGSLRAAIARVRPAAIINCIGIIKQTAAATAPIPSIQINALFPHQAAVLAAEHGARFIHFSTDCVFSGSKGMYTEDDVSDAIDLYGRTKYLGEVPDPGSLTLRSSIIGPELENGLGLLAWFLTRRNAKAKGYTKAIYSGFTTLEMANIVSRVLTEQPTLAGVWQVASRPITKFDLLDKLNQVLKLNVDLSRDDVFTCDRSLDGRRFESQTGYHSPEWDDMVTAMAVEMGQ